MPAERVGWSNVAGDPETNRVYVLGACCFFQCIDAATGKTIWSRSLSEEFGMLSTYGGRTNTPVLFENLVVISGVTTGWDTTGRPAHRFFAFDKSDGALVWTISTRLFPEDTTYSTPVIQVIDGQQVMIAGSGDGDVYGIQPRTGKVLWHQPLSRRGINTTATVGVDGRVYVTHGEENPTGTAMGAVVSIEPAMVSSGSSSAETWRIEGITAGKSSPLLVDDRLYIVEDSSRLNVIDTKTGQPVGEPLKLGTAMRGSLLYADGKIYGCTASGVFHVLRPTAEGVETVFKLRLRGLEVGGSPIASHGRIYLPTTDGLYCLGNASVQPKLGTPSSDTTARQVESAVADKKIAQLQLIPAEAILRPGEKLVFQVVAFNARGQRLEAKTEGIKISATGGGTVDAAGTFTSPSIENHIASVVTAQMGDVTAQARVRIIPNLPWKFDFTSGEVPVTWIGARYRHEARKVDGEPVIVKITTIPKGTRSQTWFGPTFFHDYTISADLKAGSGTGKLPDMGVIGQRYTLDLMGESQQLQIRTWAAQLRMAKSVPFTWKADTWYTLKLRAALENGVAVLQGKVWPREESEPAEWTLTATDDAANTEGSPGLFGFATYAEIFIDNVHVVSNQ